LYISPGGDPEKDLQLSMKLAHEIMRHEDIHDVVLVGSGLVLGAFASAKWKAGCVLWIPTLKFSMKHKHLSIKLMQITFVT